MSKGKKIIIAILILLLLIILGISIWAGISSNKVDQEIVKITSDIKKLEVGWGYQLEIDKTLDRDHSLIYESSNNDILTVDENGYMKALSPGEVTITAKVKGNSKIKDSIKINIIEEDKNRILLSEKSIYIKVGEERKIYIYNMKKDGYSVWESEDPSIATVTDGNIKALALGEVNINVTNETNSRETVKVFVIEEKFADIELETIYFEENKVYLDVGEELKLNMIYEPNEATDKSLVWASSNDKVVTVNEKGLIKAISNGNATITATSTNGLVTTCEVVSSSNIIPVSSIKLNKETVDIYVGDTAPIEYTIIPNNATSKNVVWKSSDNSVAIVENGYILARKEGTATITVKTNNDKEAKVIVNVKKKVINPYSIVLDKEEASINIGSTIKLVPIITPDNVTDKTINWTSSNNSIATVEDGEVKGIKEGKVTIMAKTTNGKVAISTINVTLNVIPISELSIDKNNISLEIGESILLKEIIKPSNATSTNVTWTSSNNSVATVHNGLVKAIKPGTVTITIKTENGKTATSKVTVKKMNDTISVNSKTSVYTGNPINATVSSVSGSNMKITYYSDSKCTIKTNNTNANDIGDSPEGFGNYYVVAETSGNELYNPGKTGCMFAITIMKKQLEIECKNTSYNGKEQIIAVCDGGTITNANQTNAGSYQIKCLGNSNYLEADNKTCTIKPISLNNANISGIKDIMYTGSPIVQTPIIKITLGGITRTLVEGVDYTYTTTNNINAGTATINIKGKGNYEGNKEIQFNITKANPVITCFNKEYNTMQQPIATCNGGTITNNNQTNVGTYNISCTGNGNYTGTVTKRCEITPYNISTSRVSGLISTVYDGTPKQQMPIVTVSINGINRTLVNNDDYVYAITNNVNAGLAQVSIHGRGNYIGTINTSFNIEKAQVQLSCNNKEYNGKSQDIATCIGGTINNGTQVNANSYNVSCVGSGNYTGTVSKVCTINPKSISLANVSGLNSVTYTGSPINQTPIVKITMEGITRTLNNNTDYTYTISNNVNAGSAEVIIEGKGNYNNIKIASFTISKAIPIMECQNKTFNGLSQTIASCVGGTLSSGTPVNAGTYRITCEGTGNYSGVISKECKINPFNISSGSITGLPSTTTYTGSPIIPNPSVKVTLNGTTKFLSSGSDYTITYSNNVNAGTAGVTVTGKGNYTGTLNGAFTIKPASVQLTCSNKQYNGTSQTIATCIGGRLQNGTQINAGTHEVTCTGYGNYTGTKTAFCTISPLSISSASINLSSSYIYTGNPITPIPSITMYYYGSTHSLAKDHDYTLSYSNNTNVGTGKITITGKGNYNGTKIVYFDIISNPARITCQNKTYDGTPQTIAYCTGGKVTNASQTNANSYLIGCTPDSSHTAATSTTCKINPKSINSATISGYSSSYTYTGSPIRPSVTIKMNLSTGTRSLLNGTDYTLSYSNNTNVGTATIIVNGKGNYTGNAHVTFSIKKAPDTPHITSRSVSYSGSPVYPLVNAKTCYDTTCSIRYYSDSACSIVSSIPRNHGIYYVIVTTPGDDNYSSVTSSCTRAITIN